MGMTVGQEAEDNQEVMSAINTTPLTRTRCRSAL